MPDVSVIVLNYNKPELTLDCLRSIVEQTVAVSYEIVVVDNASEPRVLTQAMLPPQARLIQSEQNLGFSKGNNLGIQHSSGQALLLLNNDTVLQNDAISIAYQCLQSNDKNGCVGAQLRYPDGALQHSAQRFPSILLTLFELFRLQKLLPRKWAGRLLLGGFFQHNETVRVDWLWGTFLLLRRRMLSDLPGQRLPDDFFMYVEDLQWGLEFARAGYRSLFCSEARVTHFEGKNSFKPAMVDQNFEIVMNRYYGRPYNRIYQALKTLLTRSALSDDDLKRGGPGLPPGVVRLPSQTHTAEASEAAHRQGNPGTVVLVGVFFVCFILYYFTNWKILSLLWKVG